MSRWQRSRHDHRYPWAFSPAGNVMRSFCLTSDAGVFMLSGAFAPTISEVFTAALSFPFDTVRQPCK